MHRKVLFFIVYCCMNSLSGFHHETGPRLLSFLVADLDAENSFALRNSQQASLLNTKQFMLEINPDGTHTDENVHVQAEQHKSQSIPSLLNHSLSENDVQIGEGPRSHDDPNSQDNVQLQSVDPNSQDNVQLQSVKYDEEKEGLENSDDIMSHSYADWVDTIVEAMRGVDWYDTDPENRTLESCATNIVLKNKGCAILTPTCYKSVGEMWSCEMFFWRTCVCSQTWGKFLGYLIPRPTECYGFVEDYAQLDKQFELAPKTGFEKLGSVPIPLGRCGVSGFFVVWVFLVLMILLSVVQAGFTVWKSMRQRICSGKEKAQPDPSSVLRIGSIDVLDYTGGFYKDQAASIESKEWG